MPKGYRNEWEKTMSKIKKGVRLLLTQGPAAVLVKLRNKRIEHLREAAFREKAKKVHLITEEQREYQKKYTFEEPIKFSIITPLYNTPREYLLELLHSVQRQTYSDWQLCLADGSDGAHAYVGKICREYAGRDARIVYTALPENKGISENTNACIALADGQYLGLLDHDDVLHESALFEMRRAIQKFHADFLYSDEVKFSGRIEDATDFNFKPGFGKDELRSHNYICHFTVFSRKLLERALELLGDIVFHSTFPQHEIEKETEVIIDEIQSYEDTPSELIFDDFEDMIFRNHPLGRNILGKPELLRSFRTEDVLSFTRRFYQPGNMVFFVQGQYEFKRIIRLVEKYLLDIPDVRVENRRTPPPLYVPEHLTVSKDTHQAHVMMGSRGYNAYDDKRTALYLLNNILGGPGMNSKLNVSLRERRGLVYNVESNLTSYTDTGAFCIYFGTDVDDMDTCLKLTYKELKRMRDVKMTSSQLAAAKKQLIGQIGVASDNFENNALGMAKTYLHYHKYESSEFVFRRIEELTAEQLLEVANEMFAEEYLSTLIYK